MNKAIPFVIGAGVLGVVLLTRQAKAASCFIAPAWQTIYATYEGPTQLLPAAFGPEAWSVIHIVERYVPEYGGWDQISSDPEHYILLHGQYLRFSVQENAEICGFRKEVSA